MEVDGPSRTAYRVALRRAAHQVLDRPLILADPVALPMVGAAGRARIEGALAEFDTPFGRALRTFLAVRSRVAEDALAQAVDAGVRQYVLLGAGLDTFAYRNPFAERGVRVFEVDHPATQAFKRRALAESGIAVPPSVTYVPIDFERQSLAAELGAAGFRAAEPAVYAWLGVVMYLTRPAIDATLSLIAAGARGTTVVFDYTESPERLDPIRRMVFDGFAARVAAIGEPFVSFFDPEALAADLQRMGFTETEDLDGAALNARYAAGRSDGLQVSGMGHVMWARV